ncbi:MAG: hypothetical protein ABIR63_04025 [Sphingomicrobium sp.]
MEQATTAKAPVHLWIVGIVTLLWNCFGAFDYVMSRTHNAGYVKTIMPGSDPGAMWAYMDHMPLYASAGWGLGVWGSLLGSVLLLLRNRFAVLAYAVSLVGVVLSFAYQLFFSTDKPAEMDSPVMAVLVFVIVAIQLYYAMTMRSRGVLR